MTNGNLTNGNWKQMANGSNQLPTKPVPIDVVDSLADELIVEYENPNWRPWYCGVINQFGLDQVTIWRGRSKSANSPARLFSHYVKQAREGTVAIVDALPKTDALSTNYDIYMPTDDELTDEAVKQALDEGFRKFELDKSEHKAVPWLKKDGLDV